MAGVGDALLGLLGGAVPGFVQGRQVRNQRNAQAELLAKQERAAQAKALKEQQEAIQRETDIADLARLSAQEGSDPAEIIRLATKLGNDKLALAMLPTARQEAALNLAKIQSETDENIGQGAANQALARLRDRTPRQGSAGRGGSSDPSLALKRKLDGLTSALKATVDEIGDVRPGLEDAHSAIAKQIQNVILEMTGGQAPAPSTPGVAAPKPRPY